MEDTMTLVYYCLGDDFFVKPSTACSRNNLGYIWRVQAEKKPHSTRWPSRL